MRSQVSRRDFSRAALAAAAAGSIAAPAASGRVLGANDRVTVGCIGVGNRGVQVMNAFCAHKDARTIPDTAEVIFELPSGMLMTFGTYEASGHTGLKSCEIELRGTLGMVFAASNRFEIAPERGGAFQAPTPRRKPLVETSKDVSEDLDRFHARNFLDCVKSRQQPHSDVEEGHRSTIFALLANIALATKARLDRDADGERFRNNDRANELLDYEYRAPWKHA